MAIINCAECGNAFSDKAPACPHCGCPIEFAKPQSAFDEEIIQAVAKENYSKKYLLREYLEQIRRLETDIYTLDATINQLSAQIIDPEPKRIIKRPTEPVNSHWEYKVCYEPGILGTIEDIFSFDDNIIENIKFAVWNKKENKKIKRRNEELHQEYLTRLKNYRDVIIPQYEADVKAEDERYEKYLAKISYYNDGLNVQISKLKEERKQTDDALKSLYNIGVIYPKYRGLVPITMFCEYIDSGRRNMLEGIHGMYDLYETELLGKQIVDQLVEINQTLQFISYQIGGISSQLTGIQRNQILLYEEVARGNNIASQISQSTSTLLENSASMVSSMNDMSREIAAMRSSAEMTEFNTGVTARRVDAIAKIEEYEYSLRHPMFTSV